MDIAVTSPISGSEAQHHPFNTLHLSPEQSPSPTQQRRHVQYSSPETPPPLSPRLLYETAVNHTLRSSPQSSREAALIGQPAFTTPSTMEASATRSLPAIDGQNHDRMETDTESGDSSSEGEVQEPLETATGISLIEVESLEDGEIMDTRPDSVTPEAPPIGVEEIGVAYGVSAVVASSSANPHLVRISSNGSSIDSNTDDLRLRDVDFTRPVDPHAASVPIPSPPPPPTDFANPIGTPNQSVVGSGGDTQLAATRADEDESHDEDSDEEDIPYWANFKEDNSKPDQQELKVIEASKEVDALDYDYWERATYEALDDPEFVSGESGRIVWTVKGVNGTPEKPSKETVLRSPSVLIGGYYWNIKYFPRGDEGTQYMSVFVECSTAPREEVSDEGIKTAIPIQEAYGSGEPRSGQFNEAPASSTRPSDSAAPVVAVGADLPPGPSNLAPVDNERWDVAAQVGCVVHNPGEPRVHASQTSSHHFYQDYPDFGWIRFHGPWDEIHKRQRFQRQALLQNDTLVFTAYIRTVIDHTLALWWHAPKDTYKWDCLVRTGLRQITTGILNSSALISAVTTWLNLRTNAELIINMHIPDPVEESKSRPRPLFFALKHFTSNYYYKKTPRDPEASLNGVMKAMDWYGTEINSKMDVVAIWESIRRILNYEASDDYDIGDAKDLFEDVLMLKQPDPWKDERPILGESVPDGSDELPSFTEPQSVQETFNVAVTGTSIISRRWDESRVEQILSANPSVLQVELHRQSYDKKLRQWRKLAHQIEINEKLIFASPTSDQKREYTLNSLIVHSGELESQNYSAIIRLPRNKDVQWVKFAGEQEEKSVEYLTRKQAITSHEGVGEHTIGDASVAYIAVYERNNSISLLFPAQPDNSKASENRENTSTSVGESIEQSSFQAESTGEQQKDDRILSVHAYPSTSFINHTGRGFLDVRPKLGEGVFELKMSAATPVSDVINEIIDRVRSANKAGMPQQAHVYALDLDIGNGQYTRVSPGLLSQTSEELGDCTLGSFAHTHKGCHFWLHDTPAKDKSTTTIKARKDASQMGVSPNSLNEAPVSEVQAPQDTASELPDTNGEQDQHASQSTSAVLDGDTVMDGVTEPPRVNPVDVSSIAQPSPQTAEEDEEEIYTYIFVKIFSHLDQTLVGSGSYYVKMEAKINDTIQNFLGPDYNDAINVYREHGLTLYDDDMVKSSWTFSDVDVRDGDIFIAQRPPSAAEIVTLETSGKCPSPISYFNFLRHNDNPAYSLSHRTSAYFSSPYLSTAQSSGRPHGFGTHISLSGDAYVGNFSAGAKSGNGTMAFSNGDTYTGAWADNEPNGQGKMVYAKTGNTYVGGFRKRKRHGKGTMTYEVADEEMQLCRICFEQEMDALFYDCGHVAACVECARQVSACPVCRRGVRAVVRIWRT